MKQDDELWLNAGVDGELDAERSWQLQARLAADPTFKAAWDNQRALRDAIRDRVDYHTSPDALRKRLQRALRGDGGAAAADVAPQTVSGTVPATVQSPAVAALTAQSPQTVRKIARQTVRKTALETAPDTTHLTARATLPAGQSPSHAASAPVRIVAPRRLWLVGAASALAGSALTAAVALWVGTGGGSANPGAATAEQALAGHTRALLAERPIEVASSDQHTVKPWLTARLGYAPPVPDLSAHGFELLGARRDWIDGRTVAALVYRRRQHMISVFIEPGGGERSGARTMNLRGFNVAQIAHDGMACAIVSDLNAKELGDFAELLRTAL